MSDRTVKIGLYLLFLLNLIDATATITLIHFGLAKEINPLMNFLLEKGVLYFILCKLIVAATTCTVFWKLRAEKAAKAGLTICLIGYSALLLHFCIGLL
tara:strand:- start:166 stop:462 length:297 start_codon:yes stop_codon:yes gene_type:complete